MPSPTSIICRQIETTDLDQVAAVLTHGFRNQRARPFWVRALRRLAAHDTPPGFPRFGYLIASDGIVVGVILLIFTAILTGGPPHVRCNLSSWYVAEGFRAYGPMLIARALRHREATYFNITPAPHTWPILHAQGFVRYCEGRLIALPLLAAGPADVLVLPFDQNRDGVTGDGVTGGGGTGGGGKDWGQEGDGDLSAAEQALLRDHAAAGCISLVCVAGGRCYPFVFARRRKYGVFPLALLAYCRDMTGFVTFAGPIGRFLARRGYPAIVIDADGPVDGLIGYYSGTKPKYYRGATPPRLGDTAYSERTMFGS